MPLVLPVPYSLNFVLGHGTFVPCQEDIIIPDHRMRQPLIFDRGAIELAVQHHVTCYPMRTCLVGYHLFHFKNYLYLPGFTHIGIKTPVSG